MKILGILGSPRRDGNTAYLLEELGKKLDNNNDVEIIFLRDYDISPCKECYYCVEHDECSIKDDMQQMYEKLKQTDLIILSSPIFMGGITSRLRAFMERTWHLRKGQLMGKAGTYLIVGRRDIGSGIHEMEEYLSRLMVNKIPGVVGYGLKKGDVKEDTEAMKDLSRLVKQIVNL
jgi:multimeric flavodoxin WrbA